MREFSKNPKSSFFFPQTDSKRSKTVNAKRKISQSIKTSDEVIIGKYKYFMDSLLGSGYSSKVYQGTEVHKPQKRYAIKVIELEKFTGDSLKMLQDEINIHLKLKHQNVVECFDAIKQKNHYFLILEYCPHGSLEEYIQKKRKLGLSDACEIMDQIASGYRYLISNNIVHRDIKPANILKVENRWKLADFGFAVRKCLSFVSHLNVGTPSYMPMEALVRSEYSFKSDIFALGVTFYQMIHGNLPWACRSENQLVQKYQNQPLSISNCIRNQAVKNFIQKACMIDHHGRMSPKEFQDIQFMSFVSKQHQNSFKQKIVFKPVTPRNSILKTNASTKTLDTNKSPSKDSIKDSSFDENAILTDVAICKHIYSMISNIESFFIDQKSKKFLWMALFKFLVRYVREVEKKSESFKKTRKTLYNEIKQLALTYEKEYLDYLKHLEVKVIREVNSKFSELCLRNPFCKSFYLKLKSYFASVMKQIDSLMMETLKSKLNTEDHQDKVHAFKALCKLYEFCEENSLSENSSCKRTIEVCTDYKKVSKSKEIDYYSLRKVLINF